MPTKAGLAKLYDTAAWQRRRALQLKEFPLCAECLRVGAVTLANCVDHVEPWHAGCADDINRFLLEPIQSALRESSQPEDRPRAPGYWCRHQQAGR
jgi:hypothetical protein